MCWNENEMAQTLIYWLREKMSRRGFFSGPYFAAFGLNTEIYWVDLRAEF